MNVLIVGAGLFGSIAARLCRRAGYKVTIFDDRRPLAGSPPAACLIRPSWTTLLGREVTDPAMETLRSLFGVRTLRFKTVGRSVDVYWVDPSSILYTRVRQETVLEVGDGFLKTHKSIYPGTVLVAAGVWSGALVPCPEIRSLVGAALIYDGVPKQNIIRVWAPYKQSVSFQRDRGMTWFGDGTSILYKNWNAVARITQSERRARKHKLRNPIHIIIGQRPYIPSHKKGYFAKVYEHTYVCTGGAKNGTVLAAYYARKFLEAIS